MYHNSMHRDRKIEWHHNLIFAGKQVQARFCILPICKQIHDLADRKDVRERLDWIMLNRATDDELIAYSKAVDLIRKRNTLNEKYENEEDDSVLPGDEGRCPASEHRHTREEEQMDP